MDDLEKAAESANHEKGLLRAQVERLQVELKEYRKRLSWVSSNGMGRNLPAGSTGSTTKNNAVNNDFQFEFPKFGDLPVSHIFNNGSARKLQNSSPIRSSTLPSKTTNQAVPGVVARNSIPGSSPKAPPANYGSTANSPMGAGFTASSPTQAPLSNYKSNSIDSLSGLFSPSIIEASRKASFDYFPAPNANANINQSLRNSVDHSGSNGMVGLYNGSSVSNTDSPSSSSDSHHPASSIGTSPEPSLSSPSNRLNDISLNTINEDQVPNTFGGEISFCEKLKLACGDAKNPIPAIMSESNGRDLLGSEVTPGFDPSGFNWLAQQNGGGFDPVLFGDYRESQNAVVAQDFGTFFNDAFPLPDLGSPLHNFNDVAPSPAPKVDLLKQVDAAREGEDEVVPGEKRGKMMTCNKIWFVLTSPRIARDTNADSRDRLQSMEKFRNGEIDVDNLCSELRSKAKCSEGGAVVHEEEVDRILGKVN